MQWRYDISGIDTVTLHFGQRIDAALVAPIQRAAIALKASLGVRLLDAVPSYTTLLLRYDVAQDDLASLMGQVSEVLNTLPDAVGDVDADLEVIEVPVFYHPSVGPDLKRLAQRAGFSVEEVIRRHSERLYQVFAIGFAPGFAYLGEVADELSVPRLANPRAKVPAGTLGIADTQTALYPIVSPGGWNLIGRTPLALFDQSREQPSLLEAGQTVRFRPIAQDEYLELGGRLDDLPWGVEPGLQQGLAPEVEKGLAQGLKRQKSAPAGEREGKVLTHSSLGLLIEKPGFLSLIQDAGRHGVMHLGLATGGAMDRHAWAWANYLLGNRFGAAALEITFGQVEFVSQLNVSIAITGAEVTVTVNGTSQPLWATLTLKAGDRVALSTPRVGLRSYLAVAGGFSVTAGLGDSCATLHREKTGGLHRDGQPLKAGDLLPCEPQPQNLPMQRQVPAGWIPDYREALILDVIMGAQVERFPARSLEVFFTQPYTLSPQSDRMGARLNGPALELFGERLISEGVSLGAIQVPANGLPIILLNDRQTIGGYPKLGAVTPRSLDTLAQRQPGSQLQFRPVALYEAQRREKAFLNFFNKSF